MRRTELFEIHDHLLCPEFLRNLVTDALEALWEFGSSYKPILPQLYEAFNAGVGAPSEFHVTDLCSGGGGPWPVLAREFKGKYGVPVRVYLTDKYPNGEAMKRVQANPSIRYFPEPVDAMRVTGELFGFRTMFSSFHHFGPKDGRAVLHDAYQRRHGIGIFEVPGRDLKTLLLVFLTPLLVLCLTPRIRPFRWSRLFWTYLLPVVPFVILFDGCMSCFRAYSEDELREMVLGDLADGYQWRVGTVRSGLLPVTYLIGWPVHHLSGR